MDIRIKVIEAGAIPLTTWSNNGSWKLRKDQPGFDDCPPRVLLEVSEAVARSLAKHLDQDITITIPES